MAPRRTGKIINIASEYAHFGNPIAPAYSASKGALIQLTKSMAIELAPHNIQVNAIVPGWIESDMTAPIKSRPFFDEIIRRTPAGRFGDARRMRRARRSSSLRTPPISSPARLFSLMAATRSVSKASAPLDEILDASYLA